MQKLFQTMNDKKKLGNKGEELALVHLLSKGYEIMEVNWKSGHLEVDIIARDADRLVFVEVKSRTSAVFGEPVEFVKPTQQNRIFRAANLYYEQKASELEARFDIIGLLFMPEGFEIVHLEDAFYPIA